MIRLLILLKSVDGGTGTYLEGLLELTKLYPKNELQIKVMALESPKFRTINIDNYSFLYKSKAAYPTRYKINFKTVFNFLYEILWFNKGVNKFNPNIVLASDSHSILITEISKTVFNKKWKTISVIQNNLIKVIDYKIKNRQRFFVKQILSLIFRRSNLVVTVSKDLSKSIKKEFKLKIRPVTIESILPIRINPKKPLVDKPIKNIIVSVARFDRQKDHRTLIDAFNIVSRKIRDAELWLVGDGPLKLEVESYVEKLKLGNRIKFLGWVQNPFNILSKSSLFVLSSNWEGFPLTLLEAMTAGIPVIATDCYFGPREILSNNKYGLIIPTGNSSKMADSIIRILASSKKWSYYSAMAKLRTKEYDSGIMLKKFKNNLDYLMSKTVG